MSRDLRVVVISDSPLPDARVERSALLYSNLLKADTHLIAPGNPEIINTINNVNKLQHKVEFIPIPNLSKLFRIGVPLHNRRTIHLIRDTIREINPDIVHSHNIFISKIVSDMDVNFFLDDHELYSVQIKSRTEEDKLSKQLRSSIKAVIWSRLEKKLARHALAVITVSHDIANYYKNKFKAKNVIVVPNFPISYEVSAANKITAPKDMINMLITTEDRLKLVYIGKDPVQKTMPYREMRYITKIIEELKDEIELYIIGSRKANLINDNIIALGYIPHMMIYSVLRYMDFGLCTWLPHKLHGFFNPNKVFMYVHSGLTPIVSESLTDVLRYIKDVSVIVSDPLNELKEILIELYNRREEIIAEKHKLIEFANRNILIDYYVKYIKELII